MKYFLLATSFVLSLNSALGADFNGVKTVYLMPMSNALDQYLAIQLTTGSILQVVTDPQKADAVLTDYLGQNFEEKFQELYAEKPKAEDSTDTAPRFSRVGAGGHPRGAAFLVSRKTREVIWSAYARPKNTTPEGLRASAKKIAMELEKAINGK